MKTFHIKAFLSQDVYADDLGINQVNTKQTSTGHILTKICDYLLVCVCERRHLKCVSRLEEGVAARENSLTPTLTLAPTPSCSDLTIQTCSSSKRTNSR